MIYYDESSKSCLRSTRTGKSVGSKDKDGYYLVLVEGVKLRAHRVVWELHNGEIPDGLLVDHINGIKTDNHICNLRLATHVVNNRNREVSKDSLSGIHGVRRTTKIVKGIGYEYWTAAGIFQQMRYGKNFSISKYGEDEALALAIGYRESHLDEGFSERHLNKVKEIQCDIKSIPS